MNIRAEIIAVGSELLGPDKLDTNSLYLTGQLARLGIRVIAKSVIGDEQDSLEEALRVALKRADLVITTGGLGPTQDDLTREAVAAVTGRNLKENERVLRALEKRYNERGTAFLANSRKQAMVPEGAEAILNVPGAAPGLYLRHEQGILILLPGVPREMQYIMEHGVLDRLSEHAPGGNRISVSINLAGVPESVVDDCLSDIDFQGNRVEYMILANLRRVQVTLSGESGDLVRSVAQDVIDRFPDAYYGDGDLFVEDAILRHLGNSGQTLALAESCTGGLAGKFLTDIPGSSHGFKGGVVAYDNSVKQRVLGVSSGILEQNGAVSGPTAAQMAVGVRRLLEADFGISITGIAGPDAPGDKPVGLVYAGVSDESGLRVDRFLFKGTREMIRIQAATRAMDLLRRWMLN